MCQTFVLTEHEAYLTAADADVACRYVGVGTDITEQLVHEGVTEAHDLIVRLAAWGEVGASFSTAHRQCGQGVLESLLESQELQD